MITCFYLIIGPTKNQLLQIEFYRAPAPPPYFMTSPLMHGQIFSYVLIQMTVGSDPLRGGWGSTPFVQVVGEIRGLILELEKYFPCEPLRAPTQKSVT